MNKDFDSISKSYDAMKENYEFNIKQRDKTIDDLVMQNSNLKSAVKFLSAILLTAFLVAILSK